MPVKQREIVERPQHLLFSRV